MTTRDDILIRIATGRAQAARDAAATLDQTLATVEDLVREMRPTPEPVTVERGNTADLADAEDMRSLLMEQGQEPSAAGLAEFIRFARMGEDEKDEAKKEAEAARERLIYITSGDPNATLAELVSTAGEALDDLHRKEARRDDAIAEARQTLSAALGASPNTSIDLMIDNVAETMPALRRALGCPDGASAEQIVAEANAAVDALSNAIAERSELRAERDRLAGDISIITAECARIDRAIAPLWTGDPSDCIGKRVESVAKAAHVRAETVDSLYDKLRQRDAQIAALTPGPWARLGDMAPNIGETVLMWSGVQDTPPWMQVFHGMAAQSVPADYLWRRLPAGLLDVHAPTVAP